MRKGGQTIGTYLIEQLRARGVEHIFGVAGDFVLSFMEDIVASEVALINTCDEQGAGFAADAYARLRGLGAVCVTYGVGGLKLANTTAQAFAERSPVVVLSGAPGMEERKRHPLLHHRVRDFDSQRKIFEELTVAWAVLSDPETAAGEVDRVIGEALRHKRPVYFELPRDTVRAEIHPSHCNLSPRERSDDAVLQAALAEVLDRLRSARQPVIILGEEVHRFRLQDEMVRFLHRTGLPAAGTILGKSVIDEEDSLYLGIYQGGVGRVEVRNYVEGSDLVLLLGVMMTDVNLGIYTARLDPSRCIHATPKRISVGYHVYEGVLFEDFIRGLGGLDVPHRDRLSSFHPPKRPAYAVDRPDRPISAARLFERLNSFLTKDTIVLADPGDALFGAADLQLHIGAGFLAPAYYASLGFAVPAALGAHFAAPALRPLVIVGDGAFQMTGMELSTIAKYRLNPIVIVLNNRGYLTERYIRDGPFNDIHEWRYHELPRILRFGKSAVVNTEQDLEQALDASQKFHEELFLIEVRLEPKDASPALLRFASGLSQGG